MDENSSIRMLSTQLSDTRLELLGGSAIVESNEGGPDISSVKVIYRNWQVRVPHEGVYRSDAEPPQVLVYKGDVEVRTEGKAKWQLSDGGKSSPWLVCWRQNQRPRPKATRSRVGR